MKIKKLLCKIFGHRLRGAEWYESIEYVTMGNGKYRDKKSKKARKKKVVRTFRKCRRCGAMIMVNKYKRER